MADYKKLVEALRICTGKDDSLSCIDCPYHEEYYPGSCHYEASSDAADAIEALQAELDKYHELCDVGEIPEVLEILMTV